MARLQNQWTKPPGTTLHGGIEAADSFTYRGPIDGSSPRTKTYA
jgi:hypothetical protein